MSDSTLLIPHIMGLVFLLLLAACSALIFKKIKFPYTIGLVIVGILFAFLIKNVQSLGAVNDIQLTQDIILYLILPTLIFDAAVNIDSRLLIKELVPVLILAAPGLLISTLIVGFFMNLLTPLNLGIAMLFGALISATDPVAVIALFKDVGAPKRLTLLVDGESLFNDATAIVVFNIIMAIIVSGVSLNMLTTVNAIVSFIVVFVGGVLVGMIIAMIIVRLINIAPNEPLILIAFTTVTAYTAFIVSQYYLGLSGVMSTLGAGIVISWNAQTKFSPDIKEYIKNFWEYASFVANSYIFLLLGVVECRLLFEKGPSLNFIYYIIIAIVVVTVARMVVVYGLVPILKFLPRQQLINKKYQTVIFWGGLRGAVPLALVLSLKADMPYRQLIIELTLGVVLFTLLVQGTTTQKLISLLKLNQVSIFKRIMRLQAMLKTISKSKDIMSALGAQHCLPDEIIFEGIKEYDKNEKEISKELDKLEHSDEVNRDVIRRLIRFQAVAIEQKSYEILFNNKLISDSVYRELELNTSIAQDKLRNGRFPDLKLKAVPLEMLFRNFFIAVFKFLIPNNSLSKMRLKALIARYELIIASQYSYNYLISIIHDIPKFYVDHTELIKECCDFYKKRVDLTLEELEKLKEIIPIKVLQQQTMLRAAIGAENDAIDEIASSGGIHDAVIASLKEEIHAKFHKVSKGVIVKE